MHWIKGRFATGMIMDYCFQSVNLISSLQVSYKKKTRKLEPTS